LNIFKKLLISSTIVSFASPVISEVNINQKLKPSKDKKILEREILIAENSLKEDQNNTLKITVTGSKTPRPVDTFPGSIEVITKDQIDTSSGLTLRELTDDIQGVTTQATKISGTRGTPNNGDNLNIRGLDRNRVLFLVDGIRLPTYSFGSVSDSVYRVSDNRSQYYYDMNPGSYINFNTLKAIEITKGPASALYGSDALGGLISFESLEADDLLSPSEDFAVEIPASYDSSDNELSESIKIAARFSESTSGLFIFTKEDSSELKVKADSKYIDDETREGNNYFINITQNLGDFSKANVIYEKIDRELDITVKEDNLASMDSTNTKALATSTYQKIITDTKTSRDRVSLAYEYDNPDSNNFVKSLKAHAYSQYSRVDDDSNINWTRTPTFGLTKTYSDTNDYYLKNSIYGGEISTSSNFVFNGSEHKFTYGVDYSKTDTSRLRNKTSIQTTITGSTTEVTNEKDTPNSDITRTGLYLQDEFSSGNFDFIAGIRYDNYDLEANTDSIFTNASYAADMNESSWSPKLSATYNISDQLSVYGSYSKGFRAPAYYEVNSGFDNPTGYYSAESNPDLKPETSNSYEIGMRGRYRRFNYKIAGFYNDYNDFIEQLKLVTSTPHSLAPAPGFTTWDTYKSVNVNSAETKGIEFSSNYYFNEDRKGLNLSSSITYQEGNNLTDNIPLTTINPFEAKISLGYKSTNEKWEAKVTNTFVGKPTTKDNETNFVPDAYSVTDFITSYNPGEKFEFSLGIYNLFNKRYYNYQDVKDLLPSIANLTKYSQPERYVKAGFKVRF